MSSSSLPQRIMLIGYRGTGKTTVAAHLAEKTENPWIDTDEAIARRADCSIATIFDREGEAGFRERETDALRSALLEKSARIIACGGGIVLRETNRQLLQSAGITVLLEASPDTLTTRLAHDDRTGAQRPALTALSQKKEIETILAARMDLYRRCAQIIIDTENRTAEQVAQEILTRWRQDAPAKR